MRVMYWIYEIADSRGTFPYLTDRPITARPAAEPGAPARAPKLVATYATWSQAWAHLMDMPTSWVPSRAGGDQ